MTHEALERCPFCNSALVKPTPVSYLRLGLAMMHPGGLDDNSCPLAGWGFYDEELTLWNTRPANPLQAENDVLRARVAELEGLLAKAGPFVGRAAGQDLVMAGVLADTLCDEIDAALKQEPTP